jgi:molybdopterin molybdotransferase
MITVTEALHQVTDLVSALEVETVPLREAAGRVLAQNVRATRNQPPFAASAMDGYAIRGGELKVGATFHVIGEAAAGNAFDGRVNIGEAARIFTGAPVPEGADHVVIQEDVTRDGDVITISQSVENKAFIVPMGDDFSIGDEVTAPLLLRPSHMALLASMNIAQVPVFRRPVVALVATGDELVMPGETPKPDQIIASNSFGLAAMLEGAGAEIRMLPIAKDTPQSLRLVLELCAGADMIVTIGGASVGDHDIVHSVATELGLKTSFYKVAMRPGKPLMAGNLNDIPMIGLPGNPVSTMVCGQVFLIPAVQKMLGMGGAPLAREQVLLASPLPKNGSREHYMRARLTHEHGHVYAHPFARQNSALLTILATADALLVRPVDDPAREAGAKVEIIRL